MKKIYIGKGIQTDSVYLSDDSIYIYGQQIPLSRIKTTLIGKHTLYNMATAIAICVYLGVNTDKCAEYAASFNGLEHRLESVSYTHLDVYKRQVFGLLFRLC